MGIYVPVPTDTVFKEGTYRLTFTYPGGFLTPPDITVPKSYSLGGKSITVSEWTKNDTDSTLTVVVTLKGETPADSGVINQAGLPIGFLLGALAVIVGLALIYLTLVKVEALIETPAGTIGLAAIGVIGVIILIGFLRKHA